MNCIVYSWRLEITTPIMLQHNKIYTNRHISTLAIVALSFSNCFPLFSIVFFPTTAEIIVSYSTIPPFKFSHCRINSVCQHSLRLPSQPPSNNLSDSLIYLPCHLYFPTYSFGGYSLHVEQDNPF